MLIGGVFDGDLIGFVKGWVVECVAVMIGFECYVNVGGDVCVSGCWCVGIQYSCCCD